MSSSASRQYEWNANRHDLARQADAQKIGAHLEKLRLRNKGRLTPDIVVADATRPRSPLHGMFEWNVKRAAAQHWLERARYIIRSVIVVMEDRPDTPNVRALVRVQEDGESYYTSITQAMSEADLRVQVLARALKELKDWQKRYRDLEEFAKVFDAIETVAA